MNARTLSLLLTGCLIVALIADVNACGGGGPNTYVPPKVRYLNYANAEIGKGMEKSLNFVKCR